MLRRAAFGAVESVVVSRWSRLVHASACCAARKKKAESEEETVQKSGRLAAMEAAIARVQQQFGKGVLMRLGDTVKQSVEVISSGSLALDAALGIGGLPRERVVEIYGPESSGKTTLALHVVAEAQRLGGNAAYIDVEHAIDVAYASKLGVKVAELALSQPDSGEQALEVTDTLVRSGAFDVVVVDSVAALVPRAELEGEMGDHHMALQARLMSQALRKLTASMAHTRTVLIFINQIRSKVGVMFGSPDVTSGGNALKFYASVRMEIRKGQQIKRGDQVVGTAVKVKVVKNKMAPPFRVAEFEMLFGKGISLAGEVVDIGASTGLVKKAGAWFSLPADTARQLAAAAPAGTPADDKQWAPLLEAAKTAAEVPLAQGKDKARQWLDDRPAVLRALKTLLLHRMQETDFQGLSAVDAEDDAEGDEEDGGAGEEGEEEPRA